MHFFLVSVKGLEHIFLEVFKEDIFHLVSDLIEEPSDVFVPIKLVEQPSESFIYSHDVVMKVEEPVGEIIL